MRDARAGPRQCGAVAGPGGVPLGRPGPLPRLDRKAQRHRDRDGPDGLGQDDDAVCGVVGTEQCRDEDPDGGGPRRVRHRRAVPGAGQPGCGADLRQGAAELSASGPRCDPGRRDPRPGDGADRGAGVADGPPGAVDVAHERCAQLDHPPGGPRRRAVPADRDARGHRGPAPGADAESGDQRVLSAR